MTEFKAGDAVWLKPGYRHGLELSNEQLRSIHGPGPFQVTVYEPEFDDLCIDVSGMSASWSAERFTKTPPKKDNMSKPPTMFGGSWTCREDVIRDFGIKPKELPEDVLVAVYENADWEGNAIVVFIDNGKLMLVEQSHCSCFGLDGYWFPEYTTPKVLLDKKWKYYFYMDQERMADILSAWGFDATHP